MLIFYTWFVDTDVKVIDFRAEEQMATVAELGIKDGDQLLAEDCQDKGLTYYFKPYSQGCI